MDFSDALKALKEGKKVIRKSMSSDEYLEIDYPIQNDPIIYVKRSGSSVMFTPTQGHLFAKDWEIFEPKKVLVKIKTVEYITCSKCGKDIECTKDHKNYRLCGFCGNEMVLDRENKSSTKKGVLISTATPTDPIIQHIIESCKPVLTEENMKEILEITSKSKFDFNTGTWTDEDGVVHKYRDVFFHP